MTGVVAIGVVAAILANALQALGLVFQRKAECIVLFQCAADDPHGLITVPPRRLVYKNTTWRLGFCLFLVANLFGCVIQIATLPLLILAPLQASGLVFNSLFSHLILYEPFPIFPTLLACFGGTMMASMSCMFVNTPLTHTFQELLELAGSETFVRYFALTNTLACLSLVIGFAARRKGIKGFSLVFASGIWSAHALLSAKCVSDVIVTEWAISLHFIALLMILVAFSLTQLYLLNVGLSHLSTSILYPFVFSIYNLTTILNSTMFYRDSLVPHTAEILYPGLAFGFLILTLGVATISKRIYNFEEALVPGSKHGFSSHSHSPSASSSSSTAAVLSYGSLNSTRPLSQELTQEQSTYTSLVV
ncbi:hypothetical protein C6P41_004254 [Kluyveromyces marxianus]|nr:hypothetical protein C6P43_003963 [Kluyveromyces marxianus]KAG0685633.1 hypothetical protein C6P41_004254 [Kluyveromyces marxianus]